MKMKVLTGLCLVGISGIALAECPASMDIEQLTECLTVEGSGANYQKWKKSFDKLGEDKSKASTLQISENEKFRLEEVK